MDRQNAKPKLSLVIPVYREAQNLRPLFAACEAMRASLEGVSEVEYVFVDDGSPDESPLVLHQLSKENESVRVVNLSRNFGKEIALSAGLEYATGDIVVFLDSDLQHPPALIPTFIEKWREGFDVVVGVRSDTEEKSVVRRIGSSIYHGIMEKFSDHTTTPGETDFRLLDRAVCDVAMKVRERQRLFRGVIGWLGFKRITVPFHAPARFSGVPTYSARKLWNLAIHAFVSHSEVPLRLVLYVGIFVSMLSVIGLLWMSLAEIFISRIWHYTPLAKAMVFNTGLVGMLQASVGIVGLYVAKIYQEVLGRPLFVVRDVWSNNNLKSNKEKEAGSKV